MLWRIFIVQDAQAEGILALAVITLNRCTIKCDRSHVQFVMSWAHVPGAYQVPLAKYPASGFSYLLNVDFITYSPQRRARSYSLVHMWSAVWHTTSEVAG